MTTPAELCERAREIAAELIRDYCSPADFNWSPDAEKLLQAISEGTVLLVVNEPVAWKYYLEEGRGPCFNTDEQAARIFSHNGKPQPLFAPPRAEGEKS